MQVAALTVKDAKQGSFKCWLHIRAGQKLWTHFNAKMYDIFIAFSCWFIQVTSVNDVLIAPALEGDGGKASKILDCNSLFQGKDKEEGCVSAEHLFIT